METTGPLVYFIGCAGFVKVGTTAGDIARRMMAIQSCNPTAITLLALVAGDVSVENDWHVKFEKDWHRGEWFKLRGDVVAEIDRLRRTHPRAIPIETVATEIKRKMDVLQRRRDRAEWSRLTNSRESPTAAKVEMTDPVVLSDA